MHFRFELAQVNQTIFMVWKQAEQNVQKAEQQFQLDNP
jgi:hypothetical protein